MHNKANYRAMLITTGWNDPRVISRQPAKFAATVQQANTSEKPILLQIDYKAGPGASVGKFNANKKRCKAMDIYFRTYWL